MKEIGLAVNAPLHNDPKYGATLTKSELYDNMILALAILMAATLIRDIVARLVYLQPRFCTSSDSLSYHAQSRIAAMDNFNRRVWTTRYFDVAPAQKHQYQERNCVQWLLVGGASALIVMFELAFTVLALPAAEGRYPVMLAKDRVIGFYPARHENGKGLLRMPNSECATAPLLESVNVKSDISWSWCHHKNFGGRRKRMKNASELSAVEVKLRSGIYGPTAVTTEPTEYRNRTRNGKTEKKLRVLRHILSMRVYVNGIRFNEKRGSLKASFESNTKQLTDSFLRNANLTRQDTGLDVRLVEYSYSIGGRILEATLVINATAATNPDRPVYEHVILILGGSLSFKHSGSRLYHDAQDQPHDEEEWQGKLRVGDYVGTMISPLAALYATAFILLLNILARILLRDPPGLGWELITAHGRLCADKPLTGPESQRFVTKSRNGPVCFVGYGVPPGFVPTESFSSNDTVAAMPFAEHTKFILGIRSHSSRYVANDDDWRYDRVIPRQA